MAFPPSPPTGTPPTSFPAHRPFPHVRYSAGASVSDNSTGSVHLPGSANTSSRSLGGLDRVAVAQLPGAAGPVVFGPGVGSGPSTEAAYASKPRSSSQAASTPPRAGVPLGVVDRSMGVSRQHRQTQGW